MRHSPLFLAVALLGVGCTPTDHLAVVDKVYSVGQLPASTFAIDNSRDTTLTGPSGTVLHIPANVFVDNMGAAVTEVELELKEVLDPLDMVLGNMTTTSGGDLLQTGGMLWLGATSNGTPVSLANDKHINVAIPCDSVRAGMMRYAGQEKEGGIDWVAPEVLVADSVNKPSDERIEFMLDSIHQMKVTNVRYNVDGSTKKDYPEEIDNYIGRISWAGNGLKLTKDSSFTYMGHTVNFFKRGDLRWNALVGYTYEETRALEKGTNYYIEDPNTHYLFDVKELGWANIDRLYQDPRTQEVEFVTNIGDADDYPSLYVTLLIKDAGMYLPGYRMKNGAFCFSHGDEEPMQLPVGAEVIVMATAYKDDVPHFAFTKVVLQPRTQVRLDPIATTMDKLKSDLQAAI